LFSLNYDFLDGKLQNFLGGKNTAQAKVERIIDGDTFKTGNETIRMLGINTPEKKEKYYLEAKNFLENEIANKTVNLEFGKERKDLYGRTLAYAFLGNKNVNLELVKNGFANFYFPSGRDGKYNDFKNAWNECIAKNVNLCEKSKNVCSECVSLETFDIKSQKVTFLNQCFFSCDITGWDIKDEGRKHFVFPDFILNSEERVSIIVENKTDEGNILYWKNEDYVWTKTGDTLFLRDSSGKLVLWRNY